MSSKPITWKRIKEAKNNSSRLTITQTGEEAYNYIINNFTGITPDSLFYHKEKGVWANRGRTATKIKVQKPKIKAPKPKTAVTLPPDVKPPKKEGLIPELRGGFNRGITPKNRIEIWSIEDVMRCTDRGIVGFLPIRKEGVYIV